MRRKTFVVPMESVCRHFSATPHARRCHNIFQVSRKLRSGASDEALSKQPISIGSDGVRSPTFSTSFSEQVCKSLAQWNAASPMDSFHGDPSPSDPMESVSWHFPPPPLFFLAVNFLRLSRTDTRRVRWILATAIRLHRIRWSLLADIFHPHDYFTSGIFSKSLAN